MSPRQRRLASGLLSVAGAGLACATAASGCAASERPPRIEDEARAMAPVPACVVPLPPRAHSSGGPGATMRTLSEMQYWQLVFPRFDTAAHRLPTGAIACTGARVFDDPLFAGGATRGSPIEVEEGDILYGNGGERVRIVWLRTHHWQDGSRAGAIALVRAREDFAEVYAVGAYRAATANTTLQAERLGTEVLLSATDDGCVGLAKDATCETSVTLFLPRTGRLGRLTTIDTTRRAYATGSEPGVQGPVEYELTASPQYTAEGVRLFEQVKATDSSGRLVHRTELERTFVLRDGVLEAGGDPLWGRVYPGQARQQ